MAAPHPTELLLAPTQRVRIDNRQQRFPDLGEVVRYRQLAFLLGRRDITVRYRQTVLGTIWLFTGALLTAGLFSFVFGKIAQLPSGGVPYFVFSYAGLLAWNIFSGTLGSVSGSLNPNANLISKIYFPRLVLPLSTLASILLNTALSFVIMILLLFAYSIPLTFQILLLPVWLLLAVVISMGVGLGLTAYSVKYRDVNYVVPLMTQLLLYLSPVAYSLQAVPKHLRTLYLLNPIATIIEGCRWSVLGSSYLPPAWAIAYAVVVSFGCLIVGLAIFARRESSFADVI